MQEQFITATVLSARLGVPKSSVYRMASRKLIPSIPWGPKLTGRRFLEQEVRTALASLHPTPGDETGRNGNGKG